MVTTLRKCSIILPLSPGTVVSPSFVSDLNEALIQIRGRQLQDVCIVFPAGYSGLLEPLRKLCDGSNPVHYQIHPAESVSSFINKGFAHALSKGCDALVVLPGSMIAPETLATLCSVGNGADNFGIVSARVYTTPDSSDADEQEALYFTFLDQSKGLYEWQETHTPSPFCCFFSFRLLREANQLNAHYEFLNDALDDFSSVSYALGFRTLLHNQTFHAFPSAARPHIYLSPEQDVQPTPGTDSAPPEFSDELSVPDFVLKERLNKNKRACLEGRPSLVIDLTKLPSHSSPSFEFGVHVAAAAHARLAWTTTLLVPSRSIADLWGLSAKFPKAEILHTDPGRCFDYSFYPTAPLSLGEIASFISLSPNPFFLLHEPFGRASCSPTNEDSFARIVNQIAQGILLVGNSGANRFRSNLPNRTLPPLLSILPSQYAKDYSRNQLATDVPKNETVVVCLPSSTPHYLQPVVRELVQKLHGTPSTVVGQHAGERENCSIVPHSQLKNDQLYELLYSSLFVVIPYLTEELTIYLGRALALGKIVITLESALVNEFKQRWFGPRNLLTVSSFEELPSVAHAFTSESERMRLIASYSSDKDARNTCQRWSQIGSAVNEFFVSSAKRYPVTDEDFIRKQSFIADLITSTYHFYERELSSAVKNATDAEKQIIELEERIKKLEAAQLLLATNTEPMKKTTFQNALSTLHEWTNRPK